MTANSFTVADGWVRDENGNRCSIEYWGSEEAARSALASLKDCSDCTDCTDCSRCSYCSYCSRCSGCSGCSGCSDCSRCSYCSYCSRCSRCSYCSRCSDCSGCSDCSRCSYCTDCTDCSRCSRCSDKTGTEAPPVPAIPDIHATILAAVEQPGALDMGNWHTCGTTHCRAGWAVHLAGEAGYALEHYHNTELAAMLIYRASGYEISPCRFYDSNEAALADMRRLAAEHGAGVQA